jgi:hypothetical protein
MRQPKSKTKRGYFAPVFYESIVCLNIIFNIINFIEVSKMITLNLADLAKALRYIQENMGKLKTYPHPPKKGLIVLPAGMSQVDEYHMFLAQNLSPNFTAHIANGDVTSLSINGQIMLGILSDEKYLDKCKKDLQKLGYSEPTDAMIYDFITQKLGKYSAVDSNPLVSLFALQNNQERDITPLDLPLPDLSAANDDQYDSLDHLVPQETQEEQKAVEGKPSKNKKG